MDSILSTRAVERAPLFSNACEPSELQRVDRELAGSACGPRGRSGRGDCPPICGPLRLRLPRRQFSQSAGIVLYYRATRMRVLHSHHSKYSTVETLNFYTLHVLRAL